MNTAEFVAPYSPFYSLGIVDDVNVDEISQFLLDEGFTEAQLSNVKIVKQPACPPPGACLLNPMFYIIIGHTGFQGNNQSPDINISFDGLIDLLNHDNFNIYEDLNLNIKDIPKDYKRITIARLKYHISKIDTDRRILSVNWLKDTSLGQTLYQIRLV
jgi:hypothetical protein